MSHTRSKRNALRKRAKTNKPKKEAKTSDTPVVSLPQFRTHIAKYNKYASAKGKIEGAMKILRGQMDGEFHKQLAQVCQDNGAYHSSIRIQAGSAGIVTFTVKHAWKKTINVANESEYDAALYIVAKHLGFDLDDEEQRERAEVALEEHVCQLSRNIDYAKSAQAIEALEELYSIPTDPSEEDEDGDLGSSLSDYSKEDLIRIISNVKNHINISETLTPKKEFVEAASYSPRKKAVLDELILKRLFERQAGSLRTSGNAGEEDKKPIQTPAKSLVQ